MWKKGIWLFGLEYLEEVLRRRTTILPLFESLEGVLRD
jgi:hypothetical protein